MNKVTCEIIQDLLPLYCDEVCSEESRALIRSHIQTCDRCGEQLRLMSKPTGLETDAVDIAAAKAASEVWRKNKRRTFCRGIGAALALLLLLGALGVGSFLWRHYRNSCADGDWESMRAVIPVLNEDVVLGEIEATAQRGSYLAVACQSDAGLWYVGVFIPDSVFSDRWVCIGGLESVRPGYLANWNFKIDGADTLLICFGAELPEETTGYTFTNSGVTYICPVKDGSVLDLFFIPDTYDAHTRPVPISEP